MQKEHFINIYQQIEQEINSLVTSLNDKITQMKNPAAQQQANNTLENIKKLRDKIFQQLQELEKNADWDTYTIAFYGETGAGKSTLIETLRLLLNEESKSEQRSQYKKRKEEYDFCVTTIHSTAQTLANLESSVGSIQNTAKKLEEELSALNELVTRQITEKENIQKSIKSGSVWTIPLQDILSYLRNKKEQNRKLLALQEKISRTEENKQNVLSSLQQTKTAAKKLKTERATFQGKYNELKERYNFLQKQLENNQDGCIIGDGRSDYTQTTISYNFNIGEKNFHLLDLPGIEGKENFVINEIRKSLQRAHAVFFITPKNTPPQMNDNGGTLGTIVKQLNAQTDIFSVYNKHITRPTALENGVVNEDEKKALTQLQNQLQKSFPSHYKGHYSISAMPAFWATAKADYFQREDFPKKQEKFLNAFSAEQLLQKSNMNGFKKFLSDCINPTKIKQANEYKIQSLLEEGLSLSKKYQNIIEEIKNTLQEKIPSIEKELNTLLERTRKELQRKKTSAISHICEEIRKMAYQKIEAGVDFAKLDNIKNDSAQIVENNQKEFEDKSKKIFQEYCDDAKRILERVQEILQAKYEFLTNTKTSNEDSFADNFWNQKRVGELLVGLAGIVILLDAPVLLVTAAAGLVTMITRYCYQFFREKKARQKQQINKYIDKLNKDLNTQWNETINKAVQQYREANQQIIDNLNERIQNLEQQQELMSQFDSSLSNSNDLIKGETYEL